MVGSWVQSSRRSTSGGDFGVSLCVRDVNWSLGVGVYFQGQVAIETRRVVPVEVLMGNTFIRSCVPWKGRSAEYCARSSSSHT